MGLAPYGKPIYCDLIFEKIVKTYDDGSYWIDQDYFNYSTGFTMVSQKFIDLFKRKPRIADSEKIDIFHMDIAASIQKVIEEILLSIDRKSVV